MDEPQSRPNAAAPTVPAPPAGNRFGLSLAARLRAYLFAGILVTAPISITVYLGWLFVSGIDSTVMRLLPPTYNPETYLRVWIPGLGLVVVLVALVLVGMFAAGVVGRMLGRAAEAMLARVPVVRSIYGATKQVFEAVLAQKSNAFREVVLVQFPREGIWTVGFVTGAVDPEIRSHIPADVVSVFVPTTPNPTGGYLMFFPERDIVRLEMSVEDGIKMIVSTGIVTPSERKVAAKPPVARLATPEAVAEPR